MRSLIKGAAAAALIACAGLAGVSAASAHEFDHFRHDGWGYHHRYYDGWGTPHRYYGGWGYPYRGWGDGFALSLGLPPVVVHRTYVDVAPEPQVVRYVSADPRTATLMHEIGDADSRLDNDRASGRIGRADFWRLKGRSDAIRGEALALARSHGGAIPAYGFGSLQARVDGLNSSISRLG